MHAIPMAGMREYGALVKSAREAKGMTQDDVGRLMGRPHTFLVRIEKGTNSNPPDPETMRAIWRTLGVSVRSQLVALGYVTEDEPEPGVAYVIREDDPRVKVLRLLEGKPEYKILGAADLIRVADVFSGDATGLGGEDHQTGTG